MPTKKEKVTLPTELEQSKEEESQEVSLINTLPNPKMQRFIHLYMTGQYS
jgi:hypothetical protein